MTVEEIKDEIARIDALKLGANLATRDFVLYTQRRELEAALAVMEVPGTFKLREVGSDVAHMTGVLGAVGSMHATEARDIAAIAGGT